MNGHVTDDDTLPWKVKFVTPICLVAIILETAVDSDWGPMEHLYEMATWESNGQVIDDVTWPWKVKVVTPTCLVPNISETAGDSDLVTMEHL